MSATKKNISSGHGLNFRNTPPAVTDKGDFHKEFLCPEESMRYAGSLEQLVFNKLRNLKPNPTVIEFGSGNGAPVVSALLNSSFLGTIYGYEINSEAAEAAENLINAYGLTKQYIVHNCSFFKTARIPNANYLIANPPYIPCDTPHHLTLPSLCGGPEGNDISKKLLSSGYENVFLEVSSYSNPVGLIKHALKCGYKILDFQITQMPFGVYTRQDIVWKCIHEMKAKEKAFFSTNCYLVGSAYFSKAPDTSVDLSSEFLACLTSIGHAQRPPTPSKLDSA